MFYSKYSDYSLKQILEDSKWYKAISDKLLEKYTSVDSMEKMKRYFV